MGEKEVLISQEQQLDEVVGIILQHQGCASGAFNDVLRHTAWVVGGYGSMKLKSEEWGSKVVAQRSGYICSQYSQLKGYILISL